MHVQKFTIAQGKNEVDLPQGSKVLSAVAKQGVAAVYALVPEDIEDIGSVRHLFFAAPTGEPLTFDSVADGWPDHLSEVNCTFLGTVREPGSYTWHVFEVATSSALPSELVASSAEAHA